MENKESFVYMKEKPACVVLKATLYKVIINWSGD